jgi:ABC-type nitrate/sulfonate/bicarbonate transport system substrate-binding protein
MKTVDEIIYDAITADETLMALTGGRVVSTCFEVPPTEDDNTPVPNIIISDDGFQAEIFTKDDIWDSDTDRVQATVDIAARSPEEVKQLVKAVRKAVNDYIHAMYDSGQDIPTLQSLTSDGVQWDWMKPCYYQKLYYTCDVAVDLDADNTEGNE